MFSVSKNGVKDAPVDGTEWVERSARFGGAALGRNISSALEEVSVQWKQVEALMPQPAPPPMKMSRNSHVCLHDDSHPELQGTGATLIGEEDTPSGKLWRIQPEAADAPVITVAEKAMTADARDATGSAGRA